MLYENFPPHDKSKVVKQRESNFELLRLVAILLVLLTHADFFALSGPNQTEINNQPIESVLRIFFQVISLVCVNIFVLISGWFSIRPSKKGALNLLFQILFYQIVVFITVVIFAGKPFNLMDVKHIFLFTSSHWFIKSYIFLFLLAPVLNSFVAHSSRKVFKFVLLAFFAYQTIYGWLLPSATNYIQGGYSPLSFIGLYLLARYLNVYKPTIIQKSVRWDMVMIFVIVITVTALCVLPEWIGLPLNAVYAYNFLTYISPSTLFMSVLLLGLTSKIRITNCLVNSLAASSLAVYMVYVSPWLLTPYKEFFMYLYSKVHFLSYWAIVFCLLPIMYGLVAIIDILRKKSFNILIKSLSNEENQ